ncbi:hypothetical protein [Amphibiibacter pelophylacis]|uniref:Uncharacterized protein n=1 Tax=Amphibiibacter pelophylacis TaxID=1799477 RepID=A0ACC6P5W7_9BURK
MNYYIEYRGEGDDLYPLIWCVANAFPARDREDYWYNLEKIFSCGGSGGDPYWHIERYVDVDGDGKIIFWVNMEPAFSEDQVHCGEYDEALVKKFFLSAMREYARNHQECAPKIQELIDKYQIESTGGNEIGFVVQPRLGLGSP